ncbi:MAG TPA: RHS repeat-associated core domain-containing protein [Hyphomicrobiaceae bacterium]|jgi:RHS repeat-associated protein|nr:RHS repeat-associated core domain-containing protein [Hyphomicrobiaceae bacterium]
MKVIPPPDKQAWYYHPDHLGSTSMVTNEKGQLAEHTHYFPFGEIWVQERPSTPVPYLFSSKEFDSETGLYDFGARYLNPRFAQWMTPDPALADYLPGAGQSVDLLFPSLATAWRGYSDLPEMGGAFHPGNLALYGYGHQNPATLIDIDGREPVLLFDPKRGPASDPWTEFESRRISPSMRAPTISRAPTTPRIGKPPPIPGGRVKIPGPLWLSLLALGILSLPSTQTEEPDFHFTYTRTHPLTGQVYSGKSSGRFGSKSGGTKADLMRARGLNVRQIAPSLDVAGIWAHDY